MNKLSTLIGAFLGHFAKGFTITIGVLLAMWTFLDPETVGQWQARVEFAFVEEAEILGLWGE